MRQTLMQVALPPTLAWLWVQPLSLLLSWCLASVATLASGVAATRAPLQQSRVCVWCLQKLLEQRPRTHRSVRGGMSLRYTRHHRRGLHPARHASCLVHHSMMSIIVCEVERLWRYHSVSIMSSDPNATLLLLLRSLWSLEASCIAGGGVGLLCAVVAAPCRSASALGLCL